MPSGQWPSPPEPRRLPTGTVTFLFTDIEGSTGLLNDLGPDFLPARDRHDAAIRAAILQGGGIEIATEGDSFFAVFPTAAGAVAAAVAAQRQLAAAPASRPPDRIAHGLTGDGQLGGASYACVDASVRWRSLVPGMADRCSCPLRPAVLSIHSCKMAFFCATWATIGSRTCPTRSTCTTCSSTDSGPTSRRCAA
jgi:hypothetical protein